jgi:hypothetical protein
MVNLQFKFSISSQRRNKEENFFYLYNANGVEVERESSAVES